MPTTGGLTESHGLGWFCDPLLGLSAIRLARARIMSRVSRLERSPARRAYLGPKCSLYNFPATGAATEGESWSQWAGASAESVRVPRSEWVHDQGSAGLLCPHRDLGFSNV